MSYPVEELQRFGYQQELRRALRFRDLLAYGLIFMVPIAPMAIFGAVFSASGGMVVGAYAIGVVALVFTAFSYAQMVKAFPLSGSVYNYVGRGIGAPVGFVAGWAIMLDYILVPSLLYLVAAVAMNATLPSIPVWLWLIGFVAANTIVNSMGIRMTARFTWIMLVGELIVLFIFLGFGVWAILTGAGQWTWEPLYNPNTFGWALLLGATSVAVLSFLGFDGIAMLAEEAKGGSKAIGRAMAGALFVTGLLFIAQTWVAAILTPDPQALITNGDPAGTAFYTAAEVASGPWLATLCAVATAIAWGLPDSMVAQVAISRLLYAMARDKQLPAFLAKVSRKRNVPRNAIWLVAAVSLALGLFMNQRGDGIAVLASLINFGALTAFLLMHLSVVVYYVLRQRSRNLVAHLLMPLTGATILAFVVWNANVAAQRLGFVWIGVGVLVLIGLYLTGRRPELSGLAPAHQRVTPARQAV
ncbi:APC family permease [Actinoplanes couchii]|uniref:Porin n=1 Tax=Actinoplanes couchii TaxID=403638 RepID=A0ABQ3XN19_9ACTN|nr:APC family permease [Actinoplanes couchii]MDR6317914.1 amino acid transporter [Actinoplanes couchii]GID59901.1 porin [Actinoplanes couchii]